MDKSEQAVEIFRSGACCSQAVFCAFAEEYGIDSETALKLSAGLGGGVARMREVCGAVTGAAMALGLKYGPDKANVYPHVQELCARFKAECGSIVCRDLLAGVGATQGGAPEARTEAYYKKRPCHDLVRLAAQLASEV